MADGTAASASAEREVRGVLDDLISSVVGDAPLDETAEQAAADTDAAPTEPAAGDGGAAADTGAEKDSDETAAEGGGDGQPAGDQPS